MPMPFNLTPESFDEVEARCGLEFTRILEIKRMLMVVFSAGEQETKETLKSCCLKIEREK